MGFKIGGLDKLQKDLKDAERAFRSLDGMITTLRIDPNEPASVLKPCLPYGLRLVWNPPNGGCLSGKSPCQAGRFALKVPPTEQKPIAMLTLARASPFSAALRSLRDACRCGWRYSESVGSEGMSLVRLTPAGCVSQKE